MGVHSYVLSGLVNKAEFLNFTDIMVWLRLNAFLHCFSNLITDLGHPRLLFSNIFYAVKICCI